MDRTQQRGWPENSFRSGTVDMDFLKRIFKDVYMDSKKRTDTPVALKSLLSEKNQDVQDENLIQIS